MNSLKTFFSSLLCMLAVCQFSQSSHNVRETNLPVYQNVIAEILLNYEGALLVGSIKLDNGIILHIKDYKVRDDNVFKTWQAGDVLLFKPHTVDKTPVLAARRINVSEDEKVEPYLFFDVLLNKESRSLVIAESIENGKIIRLNDNSLWHFGFLNHHASTKYWKVGERIIIQGDGRHNSYDFINLDASATQNVTSATGAFIINQQS